LSLLNLSLPSVAGEFLEAPQYATADRFRSPWETFQRRRQAGLCGRDRANTVSVLLGNGDGTFQPHVDYPQEPSTAVTVGDTTAMASRSGDVDSADNSVGILLATAMDLRRTLNTVRAEARQQ